MSNVNRMPELDEPVTVVEHCAEWTSQASVEAARIVKALHLMRGAVEHIGSTAVAELPAKPVLDLMLGVPAYPPAASLQPSLIRLGYEALGEAGFNGRLYFRSRRDASFNVHVVFRGGEHWRNNIALRQYLRRSSAARQRYAAAKIVAQSSASMLLAYSEAKAPVVAALLQEALANENAG